MRILHTADVHLRSARDERWDALGAVLDTATREQADVVVIAGDLFDRDVDAHALKTELRRRFERFPGRIVLIPGNHDDGGLRPGDFFGANVHVLAGQDLVADIGGVRFVGVPFEDVGADETLRRLRDAAKLRCEGPNVLLFHGELLDVSPLGGAYGDEDGRDYMPARLADLGDLGFDYVLAGHFHRAHDVRACGRGYFVYSGSPVSITRRETGCRHANLVSIGSAPEPVPLDTHHYQAIDVRLAPDDSEHPLARIERELADADPRARALMSIRGFTDLNQWGLRENEFHAAIKVLVARFNVEELDASECLDVSGIREGDLFRRFAARLEDSALSDDDRALVREMAIRAMMEVPVAR
jgi:DNA repair protein SbcD/Mre11